MGFEPREDGEAREELYCLSPSAKSKGSFTGKKMKHTWD